MRTSSRCRKNVGQISNHRKGTDKAEKCRESYLVQVLPIYYLHFGKTILKQIPVAV